MSELIDRGHYQNLAGLDAGEVSARVPAVSVDQEQNYALDILDSRCLISPKECNVRPQDGFPPLHEYFNLFAVHYLLTGQNVEPKKEWISEKDLPGGATFFRGPHEIPTRLITDNVADSLETFRKLCRKRGGSSLDMADAAYSFQVTEKIPVAILYWLGDEDFPSEAKLLFDRSINSHFALDIIYALAVGMCMELGNTRIE
ncbi:DUF3786 domain-containing protein [Desulfosediminicola ganghwensis]|uniref:DUF3786 domain-containing protein n=1 Tax=Desulfosediminicola ganghwensis TaxID=2569540 RepID=UPI0010ABD247|nr:DUF3786 domain-containing protein [Desulfosediminicola ganghwensis]